MRTLFFFLLVNQWELLVKAQYGPNILLHKQLRDALISGSSSVDIPYHGKWD
jgi:hypothetical protein